MERLAIFLGIVLAPIAIAMVCERIFKPKQTQPESGAHPEPEQAHVNTGRLRFRSIFLGMGDTVSPDDEIKDKPGGLF